MLYVFKIVDTPFLKMGFTSGCPWRRVTRGFWSNVHPSECCGKLGWHNLELLAVFKGSLADEAAVKRALPPVTGEFWAEEMAKPLLTLLGFLGENLPQPRTLRNLPRWAARRSDCHVAAAGCFIVGSVRRPLGAGTICRSIFRAMAM